MALWGNADSKTATGTDTISSVGDTTSGNWFWSGLLLQKQK